MHKQKQSKSYKKTNFFISLTQILNKMKYDLILLLFYTVNFVLHLELEEVACM